MTKDFQKREDQRRGEQWLNMTQVYTDQRKSQRVLNFRRAQIASEFDTLAKGIEAIYSDLKVGTTYGAFSPVMAFFGSGVGQIIDKAILGPERPEGRLSEDEKEILQKLSSKFLKLNVALASVTHSDAKHADRVAAKLEEVKDLANFLSDAYGVTPDNEILLNTLTRGSADLMQHLRADGVVLA